MKKLALLLLVSAIVAAGCHHGMRAQITGSGKRVSQKRQIAPFTSISTEGAFNIEVTCQKDVGLEVEGDDNVLDVVTAEVSNNVLRLRSSKDYSVSDPVKFKITVPNLEGLSVSGGGKIDIKGMNNDKFEIDSSGAPAISASGNTKVVDIDTSGAAKIDTHNLHASRAVVDSRGVSKVDLDVADQLDVTISGPSQVTYKGDPVVNKTVHGPGKVEKRVSEGA
ncbi:MAG TPA: head GIN domain-containing protein [Pyrinomonadaceae bacterium]